MGYSLLGWNNRWQKNGPRFDTRLPTPQVRDQDDYLHARRVMPGGVADYECWPNEDRGVVSLLFFHHGVFQERAPLYEESFPSPLVARNWFIARVSDGKAEHLVSARYCQPVIDRTLAFRSLRINESQGIRRQRGEDRYMIFLQSDSRACDDWHVPHVHAIRVVVFDPKDHPCIDEEYGCDDVWKGVRRYQKILDRFDDFLMEQNL